MRMGFTKREVAVGIEFTFKAKADEFVISQATVDQYDSGKRKSCVACRTKGFSPITPKLSDI